jgi:putative oxidoreductase
MHDKPSRAYERTGGHAVGGHRLGAAGHAVLRIGFGLLIIQHGVQKLFGWLGGFGGTPGATADLFSQMGLAGMLEAVGGSMIAVGLLTRPAAVVLLIVMLVAYVTAHLPRGVWPIQNGGEPALLYAVAFAFLAANGAGPLSVDRWRWARRRETTENAGASRRPPAA